MNAAPPNYNANPPLEEQIRIALQALETLFAERTEARNRGDHAQVVLIEERITQAMRQVGNAYPAGDARRNWHRQAEVFQNADGEEREHILMPIAKGIGLLIVAPLALAGVPLPAMTDTAPPPEYCPNPSQEDQIRTALQALQTLFDQRAQAREKGDQAQLDLIEERITLAMRRVGDEYPEGDTRGNWYRQAEAFWNAKGDEKEHVLMPIAKGLGLLIAAPIALAGGIVVGAVATVGTVLVGVGKVVQGVGSVLTGGWFQ
ncbi:unnamed protein product [Rhizoctonia solani]|uniref:Transmembrane protein n=1 Tax=Rhizoctonia solani TaxID=456999 RepID=A0A8H3HRN2_9AGAM|nr:unnamed protein product [Rhizoctonia solani]CAE6536434.1 unnamed protein product [Rhizoctonia solani]